MDNSCELLFKLYNYIEFWCNAIPQTHSQPPTKSNITLDSVLPSHFKVINHWCNAVTHTLSQPPTTSNETGRFLQRHSKHCLNCNDTSLVRNCLHLTNKRYLIEGPRVKITLYQFFSKMK